MLTANHVGDVPITFAGVEYAPVPGTRVQLENSNGSKPDLILYRIAGAPPLPPLVLSSATPLPAEEVWCIGNGWNRTASEVSWSQDWQKTPPGPPVYSGFEFGGGKTLRWGRNRVSGDGIDWGITVSFDVVFDDATGVPGEFQAVTGDSGGGCFAKRSGVWELVGVMWSRTIVPDPNNSCPPPPATPPPNCNPPPPAQPLTTAAYTNRSVIADVASYRSDIEAKAPAPVGVGPVLAPAAKTGLVALVAFFARRRLASR